jgi:quinol monooxygenase YgiN
MPALGTTAIIAAKPEAAGAIASILGELAQPTQADAGCLRYSLNGGLHEPHVFVTVEKWESTDALQQHLSSPHIAAEMSRAGQLLAEPPRIIPTEHRPVGEPGKNAY